MTPQTLFVATMAVSLLNGLVSPMLPVVWHLHPIWMPALLRPGPEIVFYASSLIVSTGTLLMSAVPAAVAERFGLSLRGAMAVWLGAAALLLLLGLA